ncbi:MAG: hypothetical protein ACPKQO_03735 [Nitrososphaeraceae archaeon]
MYSTSNEQDIKFNEILEQLIENSLFTRKQISIIYKKTRKQKIEKIISSGAYYRQVQQCKNKIDSFFYTIILFRILNITNINNLSILDTIIQQLDTISQQPENHYNKTTIPNNITTIIDQIIKKANPIR